MLEIESSKNTYQQRLKPYVGELQCQEQLQLEPYPETSISFLLLSLGRRSPNINRFLRSVSNEAATHDFSQWNGSYPPIEVTLLDTSASLQESNRISALPQHEQVPVNRLSFTQREPFFDELIQQAPNLAYFIGNDNTTNFLPASAYLDSRQPGYHAQPVSIQRNKASLLFLTQQEQRVGGKHEENRKVWITDDDTLFWRTTTTPDGTLESSPRFNPSIFTQVSRLLKETGAELSVGSFSGDAADPLRTVNNNLDLMIAIGKQAHTITDPNEVITPQSLQAFTQKMYAELTADNNRQTNHELSMSINEAWWVGKTWKEAEQQLMGILLHTLKGRTIPLNITPDDAARGVSKDIVHTNLVFSPELFLLYPYLLPPIGTIRRSEIYWTRSTIDTLKELGRETQMGHPLHPSVFHRQNIIGRPFGHQIRWREQLYNEDGTLQPFRGREVGPTMFNGQVDELIETLKGIPWIQPAEIDELAEYAEEFKTRLKQDYAQETQKGNIVLVDFTKRKDYAYDYTLAWRQACQQIFPNLVQYFEEKYKIKWENVPITVNFSTR